MSSERPTEATHCHSSGGNEPSIVRLASRTARRRRRYCLRRPGRSGIISGQPKSALSRVAEGPARRCHDNLPTRCRQGAKSGQVFLRDKGHSFRSSLETTRSSGPRAASQPPRTIWGSRRVEPNPVAADRPASTADRGRSAVHAIDPDVPGCPGSWRSASWSSTARWARCSRRTSSTRRRSAATGSAIIPETCAATTIS